VVLAQLERYGYISEAIKDSIQKLELGLRYTPQSHSDGTATYFRGYLQKIMKDWVNADGNRKPDGSKYSIYKDGLKIYTTIDSRMQRYAEEAVAKHMPRLQAEFFNQNTKRRNPTTPFLDLTHGAIDTLMRGAIKQSERWRQEIAKEYDQIETMYREYQTREPLLSDEMRKTKQDEIVNK